MHISSEDQLKFIPTSKKCVFVSYAKCVKWFKLRDPIKKKVIIKVVIFYEQVMLKQSIAKKRVNIFTRDFKQIGD